MDIVFKSLAAAVVTAIILLVAKFSGPKLAGAIAAIFFSVVLILLNAQFTKTHWLNFVAAYILCFAFAVLLVRLTSK